MQHAMAAEYSRSDKAMLNYMCFNQVRKNNSPFQFIGEVILKINIMKGEKMKLM